MSRIAIRRGRCRAAAARAAAAQCKIEKSFECDKKDAEKAHEAVAKAAEETLATEKTVSAVGMTAVATGKMPEPAEGTAVAKAPAFASGSFCTARVISEL